MQNTRYMIALLMADIEMVKRDAKHVSYLSDMMVCSAPAVDTNFELNLVIKPTRKNIEKVR